MRSQFLRTIAVERPSNWQEKFGYEILTAIRSAAGRRATRTAYSLRHMIEKYYAAHIKTSLDADAINVLRKKRSKAEEDNAVTPTQAQKVTRKRMCKNRQRALS